MDKAAWTPRLPPPKPSIARQHCRHYSYKGGLVGGGPQCAAGVDNTGPGGALPCMPPDAQRGASCASRQDWTAEERAASEAWGAEHRERMVVILKAIPEGYGPGSFACPGCGVGTVRWGRARSNKHLHAGCSTPNCFGIMQ